MREREHSTDTLHEESVHPRIQFGPGPDLSAETERLLRVRLRVLAGVLLGIVVLLMLKSQIGRDVPVLSGASWSLLVVLAILTAFLLAPVKLGIGPLRAVELVIFGWATFAVLYGQHALIAAAVASQDPVFLAAQHQHMVLPFVLLIFLYALFVPASWKRAALVTGGIFLSVVGLRVLLVVQHPELLETLNAAQTTQAAAMLLLAAISAAIGCHVINDMRIDAFESRRLGQYELAEPLGRGGMGEVWKANHRLLVRPAAIKLIRSEMLGDRTMAANLLRRFEREAQATAALTSPHTITVFDFGVTDDRTFYFVMELLRGFDLATLVSRWGPVPAGRVIHLIAQACDSLTEAHARGLIHRDIKPSNLFACQLGNEVDFVKVLDFGLVKSATDQPWEREGLTRLGTATGTPGYMSPEQLTGEPLDGRTDLYALGCVAYTLLTGELVFDGEGAMAVAVQHVKDKPVPPSRRAGVEVPSDLEEIVLACLEKSRELRPPDAASLRRRLLECRSASEWDSDRARRWWLEHAGDAGPAASELRTASESETVP